MALHLNGNPRMCIISAYAPTETADDTAKESFYEDLKELPLSIPQHTIIIIAGDFNARLDRDSHLTNSKIVGNCCFDNSTNDNGQRLIDLREATEIRPFQTHFLDRWSRLATHRDPNSKYYQLDHVLINTK